MTSLKLKDFIFPKYLLLNEIDLDEQAALDLLEWDIEISQIGEPDNVTVRTNRVIYSNPTSPMKFLFNTLYQILSNKLVDEIHKDKLGLALIGMCRDHVYSDFSHGVINAPPVLISFEKLEVAQFVLTDIIEPLLGRVERHPVFFFPCQFTDVCRMISSRDQLSREYNLRYTTLPATSYPVVLTNFNVYNYAARMSHLLCLTLKCQYEDRYRSLLRDIFTNSDLMKNLITLLKTLPPDPIFIIDFLKYMGAELESEEEKVSACEVQAELIAKDNFLNKHLKQADFGNPIGNQQSQVFRQWSQWSMMLGLIEKQLAPTRGSMWPATKNLKPFDDKRKAMIAEKEKKKGSSLNFEELLEVSREMYNHKAKPGTLIEDLLKNNRIWKA